MNLFLVQMDIQNSQPTKNHEKVQQILKNAQASSQGIIILPEMFSTGFVTHESALSALNLKAIHEEDQHFLSQLAIQYQAFVLAGCLAMDPNKKFVNLALLFGPNGKLILRYQKVHLFGFGGESQHFAAGTKIELCQIGDLVIQALLCYDLRFPEIFRRGLDSGSNCFIVCANWPASRQEHWENLLQARAIENQAWVVGVNRVGRSGTIEYNGGSVVISPKGQKMAVAGHAEELVTVGLSVEYGQKWRENFPVLPNRLPLNEYASMPINKTDYIH